MKLFVGLGDNHILHLKKELSRWVLLGTGNSILKKGKLWTLLAPYWVVLEQKFNFSVKDLILSYHLDTKNVWKSDKSWEPEKIWKFEI